MRGNPAFVIWCAAVVVLLVKMHLNSLGQLLSRMRTQVWGSPEDAQRFGKPGATAGVDTGLGDRAARCWRNDLENIPMFLILGLAYVLAGAPATWAGAAFGAFTLARIGHTVFYLRAMQPWRTIAYHLGNAAQVVVIAHLVVLLSQG